MANLLQIVVMFAPLFLLLWLANIGEKAYRGGQARNPFARITVLLLFALYLLLFLIGLLVHAGSLVLQQQPQMLDQMAQIGFDPQQFDSLSLIAIGIWLPSLIGMLILATPIRTRLARFIPIDPLSPLHTIALAMTMLIFINMLVILGVGLGNLTENIAQQQDLINGANFTMSALWLQQILTALLAIIGVGWLTRRTFSQSLERLRIALPTFRQATTGVGIGLAMVPLIMILQFVSVTLLGLEVDPDVEALTEQLLGSLFATPFGILTLGIAAALGEEPLFRGALQPRFGIILTSLLFATVHGNYGLSISTLFVFVLGLVLGWVRNRHNTTTSMITHAVYNCTLGLIGYLSIQNLDF